MFIQRSYTLLTDILPGNALAGSDYTKIKGKLMLRIALILVVVAIIAAVLGLGGISGIAMDGAQLFFVGFIILAIIGLLFGASLFR